MNIFFPVLLSLSNLDDELLILQVILGNKDIALEGIGRFLSFLDGIFLEILLIEDKNFHFVES